MDMIIFGLICEHNDIVYQVRTKNIAANIDKRFNLRLWLAIDFIES